MELISHHERAEMKFGVAEHVVVGWLSVKLKEGRQKDSARRICPFQLIYYLLDIR
ncbi:hypothetical protein M378DRAFT_165710 [Amanita muscaria Koide BX008]|uniref:Uncharacterized protein n=1 Tax=Amanita muscaria (strain Koide BX008) TaxID=946122 RepID=A0A0C2WLS7_AMAMK|nr:hypothetical protein M378DRAFT_165710 [Amanita muscaria Koide BX008]